MNFPQRKDRNTHTHRGHFINQHWSWWGREVSKGILLMRKQRIGIKVAVIGREWLTQAYLYLAAMELKPIARHREKAATQQLPSGVNDEGRCKQVSQIVSLWHHDRKHTSRGQWLSELIVIHTRARAHTHTHTPLTTHPHTTTHTPPTHTPPLTLPLTPHHSQPTIHTSSLVRKWRHVLLSF